MNLWAKSNRNFLSSFFGIGVVILLLSLMFAKCIESDLAIVPLIAMAGAFFMWSIFFKPELSIVIMIIIFFDLFGFMDADSFCRVRGIFKLKDVVFVIMLMSIIVDIIIRDDTSLQRLQSPVNKPLIALMLLVSFGIIYSTLIRGERLNYSLRMGRVLYYYLIFFITIYYVKSERQIRFVIVGIFVMACMVAIIYIAQFLLGPHMAVTPFAQLGTQRFGSIRFARLYLPGFTIANLGCMIAFWLFIYQRKWTRSILFLLLGMGIAFNFFRAYWIGTIFGIFLPAIFLKFDIKTKILKSCLVSLIFIATFVPIAKYLSSARGPGVYSIISDRFISAFSDFTDREGTYGGRLEFGASRLALLTGVENLLLGGGFIEWEPFHETGKSYEITAITTGGHLGYIDILLNIGILGLFCFAWFILVMLKRLVYIFKCTQYGLHKATILGFIGFLILCMAVSVAHSPLTTIIGIVPISTFMGLSEAILRVEQKPE